jgi:two-component sensor histidine kinase
VEIGGPHVTLTAEAAQAIAMVLHELTTNAAKHGALSHRGGRVQLRWWGLRNGSSGRLAIRWQETGGSAVQAPHRTGYGTSVIRELIPFELDGKVDLDFGPDGVRCRVEIPKECFSIGSPGVDAEAVM